MTPDKSDLHTYRSGTRIARVPSALRFAHSHTETSRALAEVVDGLASRRPLWAPMRPADIGIGDEDALRAIEAAHLARPERRSRLSSAIAADPEFVHELAIAAWRLASDDSLHRAVA